MSELQPRRALLADSDPVTRQLCQETLMAAGFVVINTVTSGAGALALAMAERPDVILLSQQLSDVPADEAVKWLRSNEALRTTPIIIMGGKIEREGAPMPEQVVMLLRPITIARIKQALSDALDDRGLLPH